MLGAPVPGDKLGLDAVVGSGVWGPGLTEGEDVGALVGVGGGGLTGNVGALWLGRALGLSAGVGVGVLVGLGVGVRVGLGVGVGVGLGLGVAATPPAQLTFMVSGHLECQAARTVRWPSTGPKPTATWV